MLRVRDELYFKYRDLIDDVLHRLGEQVKRKDAEYDGSWKRRPRGVFHMLARKFDRLDAAMEKNDDLVSAAVEDDREEGIYDDVRDLAGYLILVMAEVEARRATSRRSITPTATSVLDVQDKLTDILSLAGAVGEEWTHDKALVMRQRVHELRQAIGGSARNLVRVDVEFAPSQPTLGVDFGVNPPAIHVSDASLGGRLSVCPHADPGQTRCDRAKCSRCNSEMG